VITQRQLTLVRQMVNHEDFDDAMFDWDTGQQRLKIIAMECLDKHTTVMDREIERLLQVPAAIHKIYQ